MRYHCDGRDHHIANRDRRIHPVDRRRIDFTSYPVKTRLAHIPAELAGLYGRRRRHGALEIGVKLTQPELATMCGAAEITAQKALRDMRRSNVVSTRYGRIASPRCATTPT